MPNKLCLFLWIACRDILHCFAALKKKKHIVEEGRCLLCGKKSETVIHALWRCGTAKLA